MRKAQDKPRRKGKRFTKQRHLFFLNPYETFAFTKCPKCDSKTRIRKFPFVIHIEPSQILVLNKGCKYCVSCDLIIAKRAELESLMAACFENEKPEIIGNEYLVIGTVERTDWRQINNGKMSPNEIFKRMYTFKDMWDFEVIPR